MLLILFILRECDYFYFYFLVEVIFISIRNFFYFGIGLSLYIEKRGNDYRLSRVFYVFYKRMF